MNMRTFQTIETFSISGRGVAHIVASDVEALERSISESLLGSTVLLDGKERAVIGMESWLIPGKIVRLGEPIALLVRDDAR